MTDLDTRPHEPGTTDHDSGGRRPSPPGGFEESESRRALLQLLAVVVLVVLIAIATHTTDVLIVIAALVVMVMVHELGHFLTAKWSRMKVTEFFFGFGPRLWSVRKGETEYGIKAIPAGGYVKIIGMTNTESVDPADEPRAYRQQPFHNRLMVAVAGSTMHAVMAFVLIWAALTFVGTQSENAVQVMGIAPLAHNVDPARAGGIRAGDVIVSVAGKKVTTPQQLVDSIAHEGGRAVPVVVKRSGHLRTLEVTPHRSAGSSSPCPGRNPACIGVEIGGAVERVNPATAFVRSFSLLGHTISASVSALGQVFSPHGIANYLDALTNAQAANHLAKSGKRIQSIYGAVRTATQGVQAGVGGLLEVLVAINVFVGMFNLLPMFPLDGGHVAVAVYERIRSRRSRPYHADVNKLMPLAYVFVLLVGFIVVSSLYLDITHPVANPFQ
jgi:membrane-associated protease RseP (regulator of RpoE activity)